MNLVSISKRAIYFRRVVIIILALLVSAFIVRNGGVLLANSMNLPVERIYWPADSDQLLIGSRLATQQIDFVQHSRQDVIATARKIRQADPLDEWPFLLAGQVSRNQGQILSSVAQFEEAKRRNPRSFLARIQLIQSTLLTRQFGKSVVEIVSAMLLRPGQEQLTDVLMILDDEQAARGRMIAEVKKVRSVEARLLRAASGRKDKTRLVQDLVFSPTVGPQQRWNVIGNLAGNGNYELAEKIWRIDRPRSHGKNQVFDGGFDNLAGPRPFAWRLHHNSDLTADFIPEKNGKGKMLDIEFFGHTPQESADQVILLKSGRYRFAAIGYPVDPQEGYGTLRWQIFCDKNHKPVATLDFDASANDIQRKTTLFDVPRANCEAQRVALRVMPGEKREAFQFSFSQISIEASR